MPIDRLLLWELVGILVITIVGSLLHFCFEWSGHWQPAALFCAVNESVWEHMKIAFWPAFIYALGEFLLLAHRPDNFWFAKTFSFYFLSLAIPIFYYLYTAILGKHILFLDILIFVIAIALAQWISYQIMKNSIIPPENLTTAVLLISIVMVYSLFTYYPPHLEIFKDPVTNTYGVNSFN